MKNISYLNQGKFKNSIQLKMDRYNLYAAYLHPDNQPVRLKKYVFELFEDDIIKSPFGHVIESCLMEINVSSVEEINQLIEFLENLKKNMYGVKKEEQ
jgi:hypothetical protein